MDNRLLALAFTTLFLEGLLFCYDLGLIHAPWQTADKTQIEREAVGEIQIAKHQVRRRETDSIVWEDSTTKDRLFQNDSILTLSGSGARLKLKGNINIELHENTLVTIEAMTDNSQDDFHLHFGRGDLRTDTKQRSFSINAKGWSIVAGTDSTLNIRAVDEDHVQVDVKAGSAEIFNTKLNTRTQVKQAESITLSPTALTDKTTFSKKMRWPWKDDQLVVYAHTFPVRVPLQWQGSATMLELSSPTRPTQKFSLTPQATAHDLELSTGSYYVTLKSEHEVSPPLSLQVFLAPKIIYLAPLPRDRFKSNTSVDFVWLSELVLPGYKLEVATDSEFKNLLKSVKSPTTAVNVTLPGQGQYYWRVIGIDEFDFSTPASYSYPLIVHPDPLAPPKIRAPSMAPLPPEQDSRARMPTFWQQLLQLLLPSAAATSASTESDPPVILNWEAVPGAEFYLIEISTTKDFKDPDVVARTHSNFFAWKRFNKRPYYYRVAGGTEDRVGYFSPPELIDLTNWPPPKETSKASKTPTKKTALPPLPKKNPPPDIESEELNPPTPTTLPIRLINSPSAKASPRPKVQLAWQPFWQWEKISSTDFTARFTGQTIFSLAAKLKWQNETSQTNLNLRFNRVTWKPSSKDSLPLQNPIVREQQELNIQHGSLTSPWRLGLSVQNLDLLERNGLEQLAAASSFLAGPLVSWQNKRRRHAMQFYVGSGIWGITLPNEFSARSSETWQWGVSLTPQILFGDLQQLQIQIGGWFSREW